ncbi:MAG: YkgJ family cysteine cluster protein [Paraglaciecola chathamensis]|nr:zinc/iron-chelating domain-containing protein [Neptuniibacter pectenicola]
MQCREKCGACCIAPSISSLQKPAGVRCQHLTDALRCGIFNQPERPQACANFQAEQDFCGNSAQEALQILELLERSTR